MSGGSTTCLRKDRERGSNQIIQRRKSNQVRVRKLSFPGHLSSDPYGENTHPDAAPRSNDTLLHAVDAHSSRITESWRQKGYAAAHPPQTANNGNPPLPS